MNYTHGGLRYLMLGDFSPNMQIERGNTYGFGVTSDCVYASLNSGFQSSASGSVVGATGTTGCQLTTAWSVNAAYEHYWTLQFHESLFGGLVAVRYNALANNNLCAVENAVTGATPTGAGAVAIPGCNNNWNLWSLGTRLQYNFTKTLYLGMEFLYLHLDTATVGVGGLTPGQINAIGPPGHGLAPGGSVKDQNVLAVTLRMHKDFLP